MKKLIYILLLVNVALFANIEKAQLLYDKSKYEEAIKELKKLEKDYSNPQLHLLWAKSAEALGRDEEAMSAYERVEMLDENNIEARIALVGLYNRTDRVSLALKAAKDLKNCKLTPKQRTFLDNLREPGMDSYKAFASLSIGHDTNINIAPRILDNEALSADEVSTMFARLTASLSYTHELEEKGAWYGRGDAILYNQTNFDGSASLYDLFLGGIKAGAGYAKSGYDIYIPLAYDMINYLDKELLTQIKFEPRVNYTVSNDLIASADLSYISRKYSQSEDEQNDDVSHGAGAGIYYIIGKDYYFAKAKYESFSKANSSSSAEYIDKTFLNLNLGTNYNIVPWLVLKADYKLRVGDYDDNDRSDTYHQVEAKFSHYFSNMFEAYVSNRYLTNNSNIVAKRYTKNIFMFGLSGNY